MPNRTFKAQQKNDRTAAAAAVNKVIAKLKHGGEWANMTVEKRRATMVDQYERTTAARANHPMRWSAKSHFPEQHDEREEIEWLVETFQRFLEPELEKVGRPKQGGISYEESDDEESNDEDDEEGEVMVKKEGRDAAGQQYADEEGPTKENEGNGQMIQLESLRKCKSSTAELPSAKKAKVDISKNGALSSNEGSWGEAKQASTEKTVFFTAVSRGMAISGKSGPRRRLEVTS